MRMLPVVLAMLGLVAGCSQPTDREMTHTAMAAIEAAKGLSSGITLDRGASSVVYTGKSAACVTFPCSYTDANGQSVEGDCAVWLHRIRYRWELERFDLIPKRAVAVGQMDKPPS